MGLIAEGLLGRTMTITEHFIVFFSCYNVNDSSKRKFDFDYDVRRELVCGR